MTITEIAHLAGVSIGTVDRVIHQRGRVSAKTQAKIDAVIKQHGYQPNPLARQLRLNRNYTIGILLPLLNSEDGYWQYIFDGVKKAEKELAAFAIKTVFREFDRNNNASFLKAGENLLASDCDSLIIAPVIPEATTQLVSRLSKTDYVFVDSPFPNLNPLATIAQNPFQSGYLAGRLMNMMSTNASLYMSFQMFSSAFNSKERSHGFLSYFEKNTKKTVIEFPYLSEKTEDGIELLLDDFFAIYPEIGGVFVVNDAVHRMADYLVKKGLKEKIILIGYDLIEQNISRLKNNHIDCLLSQRPEQQGYLAVYELYRKVILNQLTQEIHIPIDIYFKENI
ncbi:MAG: substrate-binding domain-containing protein [Treponemataceae bacterium]